MRQGFRSTWTSSSRHCGQVCAELRPERAAPRPLQRLATVMTTLLTPGTPAMLVTATSLTLATLATPVRLVMATVLLPCVAAAHRQQQPLQRPARRQAARKG
jgi:hypothetical protein